MGIRYVCEVLPDNKLLHIPGKFVLAFTKDYRREIDCRHDRGSLDHILRIRRPNRNSSEKKRVRDQTCAPSASSRRPRRSDAVEMRRNEVSIRDREA